MDESTFGEVRDAVRRFVREQVLPREDEIEESDAIPADLRAAAADLGLFGYALPDEFGGSGVSMAQDVRLAFEFGYATPAFRSMFGTNNGIAGQVIAKFGSDAQKKAFPAGPGRRRPGRLVRADGVRGRVQPGRAAHVGPPGRRRSRWGRLGPVGHQAVHHQRAAG
jgi:hypothetical protein